eukprot:49491-Chlamydomonas_euryale.AAC.1
MHRARRLRRGVLLQPLGGVCSTRCVGGQPHRRAASGHAATWVGQGAPARGRGAAGAAVVR